MTKLEINIRENNGATKESAPYIGHAISKGSKNFITIEKDDAVRINFDGGNVSQVIRGTFISSGAAFDEKRSSLELAWHLSEDVTFTVHSSKGSVKATAKVAESE